MSNGEGGGSPVDPITLVYALYNFFANLQDITNPNAYFDGAFVGLPTYVKTAQTGSRLSHSHCPLVVALGLHFFNLAVDGHYLSSTPDLNNYFGPAMKYTTSCLYGYEPNPVNAGMQAVVFSGAPIGNFDNPYFKSNPPQPQLLTEAQFLAINPGHIFPTGFYQRLQNIWPKLYPIFSQPPPPPPPPSPPPPPPPSPPPPPPPSPPPPPPPSPPPPPPPSPPPPPPPSPPPPPPFNPPPIWEFGPPPQGQDELGQIGSCLCNGINTILAIIAELQSKPPSDCCDRLIAAIVELEKGLASAVASAVASIPQPTPIDVTQIVTGINRLVAVAEAGPNNSQALVVELCACLAAIAGKIPPPSDFSGIIQAIKDNTAKFDIPHALVQQIINDATISPEYSALLQGTAAEWVTKALEVLHLKNPLKKVEDYAKAEATELTADVRSWFEKIKGEIGALANAFARTDKKFYDFLVATIGIVFDYLVHSDEKTFNPIINEIVQTIIAQLTPSPADKVTIGNIHVDPDNAVAIATGTTIQMALLGWLVSFFSKDAGENLAKIGEIVGAAVGFEELRDVLVGPYIRHGIAAITDMQARSLFKQHLPRGQDAAIWMARGVISQALGNRLLDLDGFGDEIKPGVILSSYYGIQPRQLLRMLPFGILQDADVQDELTFSAMRPVSQSRFRLVAPYMSSERERSQLRAALLSAYTAGLLADADYQAQLASMEHNLDRPDLALRAAKWHKLVAVTKDLEAQYATLFEAGVQDDATLRSNLAGIGLQADMVDAVAAKSEARAEAALNRQTIRDAARLARETAAVERRAAIQGIKSGTLPTAAGALALVATGLTPTQAAAWTGLAELAKVGTIHYVFGLPLAAADAALMRKRVGDLSAQYKKGMITEAGFAAALKNLNLDDTWINAIIAGAIPTGTAAQGAPFVPLAPAS